MKYEWTEILRQSSDPEFAQIPNRIRGGSHTDDDISEINYLVNIDTYHWTNGFVKVYLTNSLANIENERCIEKLRTELERDDISMYAKDSARDIETQSLSAYISDNQIYKTGNQANWKVMLTTHINTLDCLINGSTGKIE